MTEDIKVAKERIMYCSFCGKSQHDLTHLIAAPSVFICNECVDICNDIILKHAGKEITATADIKAAERAMRIKTLEEATKMACPQCYYGQPIITANDGFMSHKNGDCSAVLIHVELKRIRGNDGN